MMERTVIQQEIVPDNSRLREIVEKWKGRYKVKFVPDQDFYESLGITRKRWAKLIRDEASITLVELEKVGQHLNTGVIK